MISIPKHITLLSPYKPGKSSDPSEYTRYKAILSSNENNYGPSPNAMEAITKNVESISLYPDPQGDHLIQKLALRHLRSVDEIILSNGLDGLLYSLFRAFTEAGDEVITNQKSFVAFNKFAKMYDLDLKLAPNKDYHFDLECLLSMITARTKIVYLCNPNNPTGSHIHKQQLLNTIKQIPSHVLVVVDEAYFEFASHIDSEFPNSSSFDLGNVLTLRTFSKLYGLAGLRIGYAIGKPHVVDALKKVKLVFNPNTLAQVGALAGLDDDDHILKTLRNNSKWIALVQDQLTEKGIRYIPSYANFVCSIYESSQEASKFFEYMDSNGILLRKLDGFGMPEAVRISIGNNEEMTAFSEIMDRF